MLPPFAAVTEPVPMISEPTALFVFFAGFIAVVFLASRSQRLLPIFQYVPPIVWIYLLPVFTTTWGVTPDKSPFYDWCSALLLPSALLLLTLSTDLKAIARLGPMAISMVLAGTAGIVIGGPVALALFQSQLDPETWKGMGALAGSWIGGTSNMMAIKESVQCPQEIFTPMIIIDSVVGYGWMAIMIAMVKYQDTVDRFNRSKREALDDLNQRMAEYQAANARPLSIPSFAMILGIAFVGGFVCMRLGEQLPAIGSIINAYTWGILLVLFVGLALSFTPARRLECEGAPSVAYGGLYLQLAVMGAGGNLNAIREAPLLIAVGAVWIAVHVLVLMIAMRLLRAPVFLLATGSMANVGGVVSTPVVAGVYQPALAPVGVLMGVVGSLVGTPAGLLCAWLMERVAAAHFG